MENILTLENRYSCNKCNKIFANKYNYNKHIVNNSCNNVYLCVCNKAFRDIVDLNRHKNRKTPCVILLIDKKIVCDCGKNFVNVGNLNRHKKICKNDPLKFNEIEFENINLDKSSFKDTKFNEIEFEDKLNDDKSSFEESKNDPWDWNSMIIEKIY